MLFAAGLFLAYLEFKIPGFGVPGMLSIACFATFLFGQYLVGLAEMVHFIAVGLGVVLIAVELFLMPGAIWPAAIGALGIPAGETEAAPSGGAMVQALVQEATNEALERAQARVQEEARRMARELDLPDIPGMDRLLGGA